MLGQRIRTLRKQKKLTLEALAGDQLTKGMLSLIENEKSKPSMESLTYLAERLDVTVSELLDTEDKQILKQSLVKLEELYDLELDPKMLHAKEIIEEVEKVLPHIGTSYESARIYTYYGLALHQEEKETWQTYIDRAATLYENLNVVQPRVTLAVFRSVILFKKKRYQDALFTFVNERKVLEAFFPKIDPVSFLDLHYHEAILRYAVGEYQHALDLTNEAIALSNKRDVYYRISDFYRLAAAHTLFTDENTLDNRYVLKLKQYADLADERFSLEFHQFLLVAGLVKENRLEEALDRITEYEKKPGLMITSWFRKEKGRIYYLRGEYKAALRILEDVSFEDYFFHPMDTALIHEVDILLARCHLQLGNVEKAHEYAKKAEEIYAPLPESVFKDFMRETLNLVEEQT